MYPKLSYHLLPHRVFVNTPEVGPHSTMVLQIEIMNASRCGEIFSNPSQRPRSM